MFSKTLRLLPYSIVPALLLMLAGAVLFAPPNIVAQTPVPAVCRAAIIIDRSGSVGEENLTTMRNQIQRLFQPTGLYNDNIQLAFWSFSSSSGSSNYNAPFNGFVSSKGTNSAFTKNLSRIVSSGSTNYEQGFGYNNGVMNNREGMDTIINQSGVLVFMTDGLPNEPGNGDNNSRARNAGRAAVLKHKEAGKTVVGGITAGMSQRSLNFVINGDDNNGTNVFRISKTYNDLSTKLRQVIGTKCDERNPPDPSKNYSLTPIVTSNDTIFAGKGAATFSYNVNNSMASGSSSMTNWSVKRLVVGRNQSITRILFGDNPNCGYNRTNPAQSVNYCDDMTCPKLANLVSGAAGRSTCTEIASGQRIFVSGNTSLDADAAAATNVEISDEWGVGTKVCHVLTIEKPTHENVPRDRYSRAVCLTIGKKPFVQIHGGDVRVGRYFNGDTIETRQDKQAAIVPGVSTSEITKADGKTYGSWVEYGIMAPGPIRGIASLSAYEGGYEAFQPNNCDQRLNKLTFANMDGDCGNFAEDGGVDGVIPDVAGALLKGRNPERVLSGATPFSINGTAFKEGLYRREGGNLELAASTIEPGKTVIVHVPDGTLTITGNIDYSEGPYSNINQIPQLILIAKNIAIKQTVVNVDAWLVATGKESDGRITTCDEPGVLTSEICNQLLTINGPVMARHLDLRRTAGSGRGGAAGDPAEIINLPAESFLWAQSEGRSEVRAQTTYTIELPPYF